MTFPWYERTVPTARFLPLRLGSVRIISSQRAEYSSKPNDCACSIASSASSLAAVSSDGSHSPRAIFDCTPASQVRASVLVRKVSGLS